MAEEYKKKEIVTDFPYRVHTVENNWIPLSDGTKLAARLWFPEVKNQKRVPAILEYIPYGKRYGMRSRDEPMHGWFAGYGYAVVRVDMRGSGESDGLLWDEYLQQEQDDALEVIQWISEQPWCDGNVGMMGKSWGGFNSLQVAARRPKALRAIITVGFTDDRYNQDIHYKGGCLLNDNFWWGATMLGLQSRPADKALVGERWRDILLQRLKNMPLWMKLWMDHPVRDDYWKHGSVCEDYSSIEVPVLAIDGWADAYTNTVLTLLSGLQVPRRGIIGPWAHVYAHDGVPAPAMGFLQEATTWWDHWLKGIDNGAMEGPMVKVWMEDSMKPEAVHPISEGHWVGLSGWPSRDVVSKPVYLTKGKLQKNKNVEKEEVLLNTPQNHGLLAGEWMGAGVPGESPCDQRVDDGMAMVFEGTTLQEPLEILGYPEFTVELSSDKPKAMLVAQLSDVSPDGAVTRVSYGVMNLTHLQGHDKVVLLEPGKKVQAKVGLDCCCHKFAAGHRVRLSLATTFWPMFWNMPEDATLTLDLSTAVFSLPLFAGKPCQGPNDEPKSASLTPVSVLTEGKVDRSIHYNVVNDTWTCVTDCKGGTFGEGYYKFDEIDLTVEQSLKRELTLCNADPLSAKYVIYQKIKIGREGWWVDADIVVTQTADMDHFFITGHMSVAENKKPLFHRTWDDQVPRIGL